MVNPNKITNYKLSTSALQEHAIFWLLVAGKTAKVISKRMKLVFNHLQELWIRDHKHAHQIPVFPFDLIRDLASRRRGSDWLAIILKQYGIGCHGVKAKGMIQLARAAINLRKCPPEALEAICGIGMKTARCFILHSRRNAQCSGLDTHLLHLLRDLGFDVPRSTPGSRKKYLDIEHLFLEIVSRTTKTPAELDLLIWRVYSNHRHLIPLLVKILKRITHGYIKSQSVAVSKNTRNT